MKYRLGSVVTGVVAFLLLAGLSIAAAATANISKSFNSDGAIPNGSIVSLDAHRPGYVQLANTGNNSRLIGVAVDKDDSLLAADSAAGKAQVAISGNALVLASTLNGDISVGDQLGASPFSGVAMKAPPGVRTVGLAQTALNKSSEGAEPKTVTDKDGKKKTITAGYVWASLTIGSSASIKVDELNNLQKAVKALTGHTVSPLRATASLVIAIMTILILVTLIYSSIYGGIISIGRNPLAKYALFRAIGTALGLALLITAVSGLVIFLLLR
jgi:hypothetical protein